MTPKTFFSIGALVCFFGALFCISLIYAATAFQVNNVKISVTGRPGDTLPFEMSVQPSPGENTTEINKIFPDGDIASWVTLDKTRVNETDTRVIIAGNVMIPENAYDGPNDGSIKFQSFPTARGAISLITEIKAPLSVMVIGGTARPLPAATHAPTQAPAPTEPTEPTAPTEQGSFNAGALVLVGLLSLGTIVLIVAKYQKW